MCYQESCGIFNGAFDGKLPLNANLREPRLNVIRRVGVITRDLRAKVVLNT